MLDPAESLARRALARPPHERAAYLDGACDGDVPLRARAEDAMRLLGAAATVASALPSERATVALPPRRESVPTPVPNASLSDIETVIPAANGSLTTGGVGEGPGSEIGQYKILQLIGEGGFGYVFMAQQSAPVRRKVALKIVKPGMDSKQVIGRFESERQALAMMDHPNIARVFDAGTTTTGRPYFVMELVRGEPITAYCDSVNMSTRDRLSLFIDVCHAVQHAHHKGIIHRDLKPSNVLVTLHDDKPVVKVIDFGIAKAMNQDLTENTVFTEFKQFIGTPEYMSPEQAAMSGLDVDSRTDIYSLGVLLYELMSGSTPFDPSTLRGAGLAEIQRIIKEQEPERPSTRVSRGAKTATGVTPSVTQTPVRTPTGHSTAAQIARLRRTDPRSLKRLLAGDLDWIVLKAMEKDRARRYDSASALADDIRRYLHDEPILARPPSAAYRLRKLARRNRAVIGAIGGITFALVLTLAGLSYGLVQARNERDQTAFRETLTRAEMLLSSMNSVRKYTANNVRPALQAKLDGDASASGYNLHFVPEMVPGFSARQVFANFRDNPNCKDFLYKEASSNPTNRENKADDFEARLIADFDADRNLKQKEGTRTINGVENYYIARPMVIADAKCLDCHTTPEAAPPRQVELYSKDGWNGGYGWKLNDMVAAQLVYVPVSQAVRAGHQGLITVLATVAGVCLFGGLASVLLMARRR